MIVAATSSSSALGLEERLAGFLSPERTAWAVWSPASCQRCKILFMYAQLRPPVFRQAYSQSGEFLMLAKVEDGVMTTIKSFFEV